MNKKKLAVMLGGVATSAIALAEGEAGSGSGDIIQTLQGTFTNLVNNAATATVSLLTAGAAIVAALYGYRVLKRALSGSK